VTAKPSECKRVIDVSHTSPRVQRLYVALWFYP
jgi:hypothetical protein